MKMSISAMRINIKINDIPMYQNNDIFPLHLDMPINQWLKSGENRIVVNCDSGNNEPFDEGSKINIKIYSQDYDDLSSDESVIWEISNVYTKEEPDTDIPKELRVDETFNINFHIKTLYWESCLNINNNQATIQEILDILKQHYPSFRDKNVDEIVDITSFRNNDIAKSIFKTGTEYNEITRRDFSLLFDDSGWEIEEFLTDEIKLNVYGLNKLAEVKNKWNTSPIVYVDKETGVPVLLNFLFCKHPEDGWKLIR
jgi:hypothetical protein